MSKHTREKFGSPPLNVSKSKPIEPPAGAVWNGIRRLWMIDGVAVEPQPPAPGAMIADPSNYATITIRKTSAADVVPPAVKVEV